MKSPLLLFALAICSSTLVAQQVDPNFHSPVPRRAAYITTLVTQPDGNILVGGDIVFHGNTPVGNLIRIRPDGTLDETFSFEYASEWFVQEFALKADGDIVVLLTKYNTYRTLPDYGCKLAVLNSDGSIEDIVDTVPLSYAIAVQDDGKILVGGTLETQRITRYNADLTEDTAFKAAVSINGGVSDIKIYDGKIYVSGFFDTVNGVTKNDVVRLYLDGSVDDTFDTGTGTTDFAQYLTIMEDGKILIGGSYINAFDGNDCGGSVRLNTDGSVDEGFAVSDLNGGPGQIFVVNGGIYMSAFTYHNDTPNTLVFRLDDNGNRDTDFEPIPILGYDAPMAGSGDDLFIGRAVTEGNIYGLTKSNDEGVVDAAFTPHIARLGAVRFGDLQDDKFIIGGDFLTIDGINTVGLARLNTDGTVDDTFTAEENRGEVTQMELLDDGTTLVSTSSSFYKVDNDGNTAPDFNWAQAESLYYIGKFEVLPTGKIIAADGNTLDRLNSNGTPDETFELGHVSSSTGFGFDMQGDSIIYGFFGSEDLPNNLKTQVRRITPAAVFDPTFNTGSGPTLAGSASHSFVSMIKVLHNKEILVGGHFDAFDGHPVKHGLVKLSKDGAIDLDFNDNQAAAEGAWSFYSSQVEQVGSKIYMWSDYAIYVIDIDGTVDSFEIPLTVKSISDIIVDLSDVGDEGNGRTRSDNAQLYILGSFNDPGDNAAFSLAKVEVPFVPVPPAQVIMGLGDQPQLALDVYPQPTSGVLNIRFNNQSAFKAAVYSMSGAKVAEHEFGAHNGVSTLDVSQIPAGFYALKVISADGKIGHAKFVRTR